MKKYLFILTLVLVFVLTMGAQARTIIRGYDDVLDDTADLEYEEESGEVNYDLKLLEKEDSGDVNDGFDHYLQGGYGVTDSFNIGGELFYNADNDLGYRYLYLDGQFKLVDKNVWKLAGKIDYANVNDTLYGSDYYDLTGKILSDVELEEGLIMHNNLALREHEHADKLIKFFTSGFTYDISKKRDLRAGLYSDHFQDFEELQHFTITGGLKNIISEVVEHELYVEKRTDESNLNISNTINYQVQEDIEVSGALQLNTDAANSLEFTASMKLTDDISLRGEYYRRLGDNDYNYLNIGASYEI